MTALQAGPSFSSVVISLKRMPSAGKSLISRIFARSSAAGITELHVTRKARHDATRKSFVIDSSRRSIQRSVRTPRSHEWKVVGQFEMTHPACGLRALADWHV